LRFALIKALAFKVYDGKEGNPFFRAQELLEAAKNYPPDLPETAKSEADPAAEASEN